MPIGVLRFRIMAALLELRGEPPRARNSNKITERLQAEDIQTEVPYTVVHKALEKLHEKDRLVECEELKNGKQSIYCFQLNDAGIRRFRADCDEIIRVIPLLERALANGRKCLKELGEHS